ncbi:MAG: DUF4159 domain-containing protein [Bacteroidales bacterium]|jgi:hypothetical protein|nr:DUF4159 domain-containing protein [Bacteroidales bacterium]
MKFLFAILLTLASLTSQAQQLKIALMKYSGGGDWYANPTSLPNLVKFCNQELHTNISDDIPTVEPGSVEIFNYPYIHATGHGNVIFSPSDVDNLRRYLLSGGFFHFDDNYGTKDFVFREMAKVFPEAEMVELPTSFEIFHQKYDFPNGLPKIHEHDNHAPVAYAMFHEGRLVFLYTWECDLGDGWEDPQVHNDTQEAHQKALKMGANIIQYVFNHN